MHELYAVFELIEGPGAPMSFRFRCRESLQIEAGRSAGSAIRLDDESVAEIHARFTWIRVRHGFHMLMEAADPTAGTFINFNKCDSTFLESGDRVGLGKVQLTFRLEGDESGASALKS